MIKLFEAWNVQNLLHDPKAGLQVFPVLVIAEPLPDPPETNRLVLILWCVFSFCQNRNCVVGPTGRHPISAFSDASAQI